MPGLADLRRRQEVQFVGALWRASPRLATVWWVLVGLRGLLPAAFAISMGTLIGAVAGGRPLAGPLVAVAVVFVLRQVLGPVHHAVGTNLGDRTAAWLYDQLTDACVTPAGMGHLEDPALAADLTVARDFDLGITGPPMSISMDFIANGLILFVGGVGTALVLFGYAWWAPLLLALAWLATHWLLRESAVWWDRQTPEVRAAMHEAEYSYRLAVDPPAAKEVRLFGLGDWIVERFVVRRRRLHALQYEATRLRQRPLAASILVVAGANLIFFLVLGRDLASGGIDLAAAVVYAQAALGTGMIAFGGLNWALDGTAAPVAAVARLRERVGPAGALPMGTGTTTGPGREIRLRGVEFTYPGTSQTILRNFDLTIPAGTSVAIVGRNGAGKTTLAKLLCRLYDPDAGAIEVDGVDLRELDIDAWRSRVTAVFQDFVRYEWSLRDNVAPLGASEADIRAALADAGASDLADLDTVLAKGYPGGTDLSGGQWQRVALARVLCAVRQGAGLVLLDEPTAQLDVRGEAEIFERILAATRHVTTILVSHRFSTVRQADRICVVEDGRVIEFGSHDELMALGGRYHTMFELQASRFAAGLPEEEDEEEGEIRHDVLA